MDEKILFGPPIYTMNAERTVEEALAVVKGKIEYVGAKEHAFKLWPDAEKVELEGGCLIPGFIDAHLYLKEFSAFFSEIDLTDIEHNKDLTDALREVLAEKKEGDWLAAGGLKASLLTKLTRSDLDEISSNHSIVLFSGDMETAVASSAALHNAGIDEHRGDPLGGTIVRDIYNMPTGILQKRAIELVKRKIPEEKSKKIKSSLSRGLKKLLSYGITSFCDCSFSEGGFSFMNLSNLVQKGAITPRTVVMVGENRAKSLREIGIPSLFGNDYLRIGGVTLIMDGSLAALTGYMSNPYRESTNSGMLMIDHEELYTLIKSNFSNSIWASVQCTGDKACEIALDVFRKVSKEKSIPRLLKRIDYAQALKDEDVEKIARSGVIAVMCPGHIPAQREHAMRYLGPEARLLFRFRSLLDAGGKLALASDAPFSSVDPLHGIYCAVERKGYEDGPERRFYPRENIGLDEAVYAYTMGGAEACGVAEENGSIEEGKCADMVVLSGDIFKEEPESLKDIEVLMTMVGGEIAYQKKK
jgi:predicted amidohydrolase YtcJ